MPADPPSLQQALAVLRDALAIDARAEVAELCAQIARATGALRAGADTHGLWIELDIFRPYRLRWIEPGTYLQGSPPTELGRASRSEEQREVTLTRGFFLGATLVTWAHYLDIEDEDYGLGWEPDDPWWEEGIGDSEGWGPDRIAAQMTGRIAEAYARAVRHRYPALDVQLPTEAEWEYAARAGTTTATWAGDLDGEETSEVLDAIAWYEGNSDGESHPVAEKEPNPWGLYDMLGNEWELCADEVGIDYGDEDDPDFDSSDPEPYPPGPHVDPLHKDHNHGYVARGGDHESPASECRAASRIARAWAESDEHLAFRLAAYPEPTGRDE